MNPASPRPLQVCSVAACSRLLGASAGACLRDPAAGGGGGGGQHNPPSSNDCECSTASALHGSIGISLHKETKPTEHGQRGDGEAPPQCPPPYRAAAPRAPRGLIRFRQVPPRFSSFPRASPSLPQPGAGKEAAGLLLFCAAVLASSPEQPALHWVPAAIARADAGGCASSQGRGGGVADNDEIGAVKPPKEHAMVAAHQFGGLVSQHDIAGLPFAVLIACHPASSSDGADASVNRQRRPCSGHTCAWPDRPRPPCIHLQATAAGRQAGGTNAVQLLDALCFLRQLSVSASAPRNRSDLHIWCLPAA
ncbi:hypothetical protein C2845_PM09G22060 [Panicum miliaceum]|uniref:Uncharacterized protein n=1 Tax=Panicum miliaceum TaxID=4540 RepID=A0A3L6RYK0_PANMI|nr:hypothetical protein C2845_PM09G22060 [Panicum miliaceum]